MNQDRRGERESGESEPHFSRLRSLDTGSSYGEARQSAEGATAAGLPTEGSQSEMAFGPLTRLEPLLIDPQAKECADEAPLPGVRAMRQAAGCTLSHWSYRGLPCRRAREVVARAC